MNYKRKYYFIVFVSFLTLLVFVRHLKQTVDKGHMYITKETLNMAYVVQGNSIFKGRDVTDLLDRENENWTILMTVNDGYFDFFQNWIYFYNKLQIAYPVIVIAEDDIVFKKLEEKNGRPVYQLVRSWRISIHSAHAYGTREFKELASGRPSYILRYLENGTNILYADTDSVWLQNPFPFFNGTYDMWMQVDGQPDNLCTGFMAIKSNSKTIKLMKLWETSLKHRPDVIQPAFNRANKHSEVHIKQLDMRLFPPGQQFFREFSDVERNHVVVVHNNFIRGHDKKLARFKTFNLWFSV